MLIVSAIVVVLSWEGYLTALQKYPLRDPSRFYLDVIIVFVYLILLEFSHANKLVFWYGCIVFIFVLYSA